MGYVLDQLRHCIGTPRAGGSESESVEAIAKNLLLLLSLHVGFSSRAVRDTSALLRTLATLARSMQDLHIHHTTQGKQNLHRILKSSSLGLPANGIIKFILESAN